MDALSALHRLKKILLIKGGKYSGWDEFLGLFTANTLEEALPLAEASVKYLERCHSIDDGTYFDLVNRLNERLLIYNVVVVGLENDGEIPLTDDDLDRFVWRDLNHPPCLMDIGGRILSLTEIVAGETIRRPENVYFNF